jgi:superfamily I DNA and/or RNA helicase
MFKLVTTARSFNGMMLHICRIVNEEPKVHAIEGAFDKEASKFAEDLNFKLHGIRRTAVFLNVQGSITSITATKSAYNVQIAIVVMDCIVRQLAHINGSDLVYLTGYNAQLLLVNAMRDVAIQDAIAVNNLHLARQLTEVRLSTVDSFMGNESLYAIVDYGEHIGHLFNRSRFLVANTRARNSITFIGDSLKLSGSSRLPSDHPLLVLLRYLENSNAFKCMNMRHWSKLPQYSTAQKGMGL